MITLLIICSGRDNSGNRGGHGRDSENYDKPNSHSASGRRGGSYQGRGGRSDNDREGGSDRKGAGRRGGHKSIGRGGTRDTNYDGGRSPATDDHPNESNSSSRLNGQIVKNGAAATGSCSETRGVTSSLGEDSGMSSLSSADGNKSGISTTANDSKVLWQILKYLYSASVQWGGAQCF